MKTKNKNLMTLEEFKEKNYGKRGTKERDELESGYEAFKIGALIHDTRIEMGMTQEQLAEKVGTTKSYISKIENNIKDKQINEVNKDVSLKELSNLNYFSFIKNKYLLCNKKMKYVLQYCKEIVSLDKYIIISC